MSDANYINDIELAMIAQVKLAKRPTDNTKDLFNLVDVFRGETEDALLDLIRENAPSCWFRLDRALNAAKEFEEAIASGQTFSTGTTEDREQLIWSVFLCAKSLRAPRELSQGGPGVIGAYELMTTVIGPPNSIQPVAGQLRGFRPTPISEPLVYVGRKLLGQTTTAAAYEVQFRTRVQL